MYGAGSLIEGAWTPAPTGLVLGDSVWAGRRGVVLLRAQLGHPRADVRTLACCMRFPAAASVALSYVCTVPLASKRFHGCC